MSRWSDLTHILTALSAKRKCVFFHRGVSEIPKAAAASILFSIYSISSITPLVHSKQKTEEVGKKINSTVSAEKKSKAQLN